MTPAEKTRITWMNMKRRCLDVTDDHYHRYGGRGIRILWSDLAQFRADMMPALIEAIEAHPGARLSIDRIDNDGHYSTANCQWLPVAVNSSKDNLGRPKSLSHRAALSKERKGKPQTPARTAARLRSAHLLERPVECMDKSGHVITVYRSIKEGALQTGCISQNIQEVCAQSNPRRKSAGGYLWRYL